MEITEPVEMTLGLLMVYPPKFYDKSFHGNWVFEFLPEGLRAATLAEKLWGLLLKKENLEPSRVSKGSWDGHGGGHACGASGPQPTVSLHSWCMN